MVPETVTLPVLSKGQIHHSRGLDRAHTIGSVPLVVFIHGGAWMNTFTDVAAALDSIPEMATRFPELSTHDELVVGHSTDAQLAVWGSTRGNLEGNELGSDPSFIPRRVISLSGPLDLVWSAEHGDDRIEKALGGTPDQVPDRFDRVDPIQNINPAVAVLAVHGEADGLVPKENSIRCVEALNKDGGPGI